MFLHLCSVCLHIKNLIFVNVWQGQHCQIRNESLLIFRKLLRSIFLV